MVIAFLRTIILYLFIIVGIRLMGKRQVGELEPSELVLALLIADLAAVPMQDFGIPLLTGLIPILTLLCLTMALSVLTMKSVRVRALLCGRPSIIVENGKLRQGEMRRNRFMETNGQLSVLPCAAQKPPTARDLDLHLPEPGLPVVLINDGRVMSRALRRRGLDEVWLDKQLKEHHVRRIRDVFLLTVDETNQVCLIEKEALR